MITPWGELAELDLSNSNTLLDILSADKHSLIEGAAIEHLTEEILAEFSKHSTTEIQALDVETIVVNGYRKGWFAFVWVKSRGKGLGRFLEALENQFRVFIVEFDETLGEFITSEFKQGLASKQAQTIQSRMSALSGIAPKRFEVEQSVRDGERTKAIYHGYLRSHIKFCKELVLMRLLINCGIQEHFRAVWNLDRAFIVDGNLWLIEIKHKYPIFDRESPMKSSLKFGINIGELQTLKRVSECGIRLLHSILVKPYWDKETSSMHLFTNLRTRSDAALIALELNNELINQLCVLAPNSAGKHTSINGKSPQKFISLAANKFSLVGGLNDNPSEVSEKLIRIMKDENTNNMLDDSELHRRRFVKTIST